MAAQLTSGGIHKLFNENVESPVFQVLTIKSIQSGNHDRFRMKLSDGTHYSACCMLGTQLNDVAENLAPNSIIRINRYVCNTIHETKKVAIILDLDVLHSGGGEIIGNPIQFETTVHQGANAGSNSVQQFSAKSSPNKFDQPRSSPFNRGSLNANQGSSFAGGSSNVPVGVHPISSLTPYQNKWTICARVTNKSDIRTWNNSRGQGKLFSMDLLDESGEIRATAFNEQCDKFYNMIEIEKVYYITQAQLKTADKRYSSLKHDYEMTFIQGTQVAIILDPDVLQMGKVFGNPIGNPTCYDTSLEHGISGNAACDNSQEHPTGASAQEFDESGPSCSSQCSSLTGSSSFVLEGLQPISSFKRGQKSCLWTIRVRVTNKSEIIPYVNSDGEGVRFFFHMRDESGEIRAVAFDTECNKFYNMIEVNKVYYIKYSAMEDSKKEYNPMKNDFEMVFNCATQVQLCKEETTIPCERFQFVSIDKIKTIKPNKLIDVIGVCKKISDTIIVNGLEKIDIRIVDDSEAEIQLTLWEFQAEIFKGHEDSIIAVKGAKVTDYFGRSLSIATTQIVEIDPDIEESYNLRTWWDKEGGCNISTENLSINPWNQDDNDFW